MRKIVNESLFEAELNLPPEQLEKLKERGRELYGFSGPSPEEKREMMSLMGRIMQIQEGNEDKLTEIGKALIRKHYGEIIDDVILDVKIVPFNDPEKKEITMQATQEEEDEETGEEESDEDYGPEPPQEEVDKRKLINNLMQGEAQNIHSLMYDAREQVNEIDENLLDLYMRHLKLNKKFDWDESVDLEEMVKNAPEFANVMKTDYEEEDDEGGDEQAGITPKIIARVVDLPMLLHETIKGIYELISANAIPEDPIMAKKIMQQTDTVKDEQVDIKYGPFIAADVRDYVNEVIDEVASGNVPNLREFIFGKMVELPANDFVNLITNILQGEKSPKKHIKKMIQDIEEEYQKYQRSEVESGFEEEPEEEAVLSTQETEEKDYSEMSKSELEELMNQALENEDYETLREIKPYLSESARNYLGLYKFLID